MLRRLSALASIALVALLMLPAVHVLAEPATVTGTMTIREKVTLSPNAVAVFSIVGQQATTNAGGIVGYQRIDNATTPVQFSVPYDTTSINPKQSYAIFGSIIDGSTVYQTFEPVPVITGGPTSGVELVATDKPPADAGAVTGTIVLPAKVSSLTSSAVAVAALIDSTTGTTIARQVIPSATSLPIPFSIAVDTGVIDPTDTYVAKAGVVDGGKLWAGLEGVPAVENGKLLTGVTVAVTKAELPSAPPSAPASTEPTAAPTAEPTAPPTEQPTATPEPTPGTDARTHA